MDEKDSVSTFVSSDALESIASDLIKSDMSVSIEYDADGVIRGLVLEIQVLRLYFPKTVRYCKFIANTANTVLFLLTISN